MHLKRISKDIRKKIIAGVLASTMALGGLMMFKHQTNKIKDLKQQLQLKQQLEEQSRGYTESILDVKTIKGEFNKLKDYPILKNYRITMTHTYDYLKYGKMGIKRKATLSGSATCLYNIDIRLSNANIFVDNKNVLHVELEEPFLNKESVHLEENTFLINERKSDMNFWMKKEDAQDLMRYWSNSFNTSAIEKLEDYYNEEYQREKLNAIAKQEVASLLRTLKVEKFKITIK